jgi:hypothetical protein
LTTWHEQVPLTADQFRCDLCGEQALTIHLVPWCTLDCEEALFACERHDPGGYWFGVSDFLDDTDRWVAHLGEKVDYRESSVERPGGLLRLQQRLHALTYVEVEAPPRVRVHVPPRMTNGADDRLAERSTP